MPRLHFTNSPDGHKRATVKIEFRAGLDRLETAIILAFENDPPEEALQEIPRLTKTRIAELVEESYRRRGTSVEFVGEHVDSTVIDAATERLQELWPELFEGLPLAQVLDSGSDQG